MGCFRTVLVQARSKMRAVPYSPSCWDSSHGTTHVFVSCRHDPKHFVSCRALGRAKWSCRGPPKNSTAQVPLFFLFFLFPLLFSLSPLSLGYHSCGGPGVGLWFVLWRFVFWTSRRTTDKLVYTALRFHRAKQPPAESPFTPSPICSLLINKLIWSQRWLLVKQEEPGRAPSRSVDSVAALGSGVEPVLCLSLVI